MKKILTAIVLFLSVQLGYAQDFANDVQKSNEDIANPKKTVKPKTWMERGDLFKKIADEPIKNVAPNTPAANLALFTKGEKLLSTKEVASPDNPKDLYKVNVYEDKEIYMQKDAAGNEVVAFARATKTAVDNPLDKALEAYKKAEQLGGDKKAIGQKLENLNIAFQSYAIAEYTAGQPKNALNAFKQALACTSDPTVGKVDTATINNVGYVATKVGDYKTAEEYYTKAMNYGYENNGEIYASLTSAIQAQGDTARAAQVLMDAYKKYPENLSILSSLINYYLKIGEDPKKVLPIIHNAQKGAPNNASLYYVEGNLYMQLNDEANALKAYEKSIAVDKQYPNSYYAIGTMYYNNGVKIQNAANDDTKLSTEAYDAEIAKANIEYKKSIEPLQKAYDLNSNERAFAEALKSVYFRFREESPEMKANYEKYKAICDK